MNRVSLQTTESLWRRLQKVLRHLWLDGSDTRKLVPDGLAEKLREQMADSESGHTGQIRICVESGLPAGYLWQYLWHRVPMQELGRQRALDLFSRLRVWDTEANNGVLIYLMLAERDIELVADRALMRLAPASFWQAAADQLSAELCDGAFEAGLCGVVATVDGELRRHFAVAQGTAVGHPNELPDEPVLL